MHEDLSVNQCEKKRFILSLKLFICPAYLFVVTTYQRSGKRNAAEIVRPGSRTEIKRRHVIFEENVSEKTSKSLNKMMLYFKNVFGCSCMGEFGLPALVRFWQQSCSIRY